MDTDIRKFVNEITYLSWLRDEEINALLDLY